MELVNISKNYIEKNKKELNILKDITISFEKNTFYVIMGESGAGKTTLINILGLLDKQTSGDFYINNINTKELTESEKLKLRNEHIGFVFQSYFLDKQLTALENVMLPQILNNNISNKEKETNATNLLIKLGLKERLHHYPDELSGGECQRVAISRALINNPDFIIADEPTGNLDKKNEQEIFKLLKSISQDGKCVIVVSHNESIKKYADKVYSLKEGKLSK